MTEPESSSGTQNSTRHTTRHWPMHMATGVLFGLCALIAILLWVQHSIRQAELSSNYNALRLHHKQLIEKQFDRFVQSGNDSLQALREYLHNGQHELQLDSIHPQLEQWWRNQGRNQFSAVAWTDRSHSAIDVYGSHESLALFEDWFRQPPSGNQQASILCQTGQCYEVRQLFLTAPQGHRTGQIRLLRPAQALIDPFPNSDTPVFKAMGLLKAQPRNGQSWQLEYYSVTGSQPAEANKFPIPININASLLQTMLSPPEQLQSSSYFDNEYHWTLTPLPNDYAPNLYALSKSGRASTDNMFSTWALLTIGLTASLIATIAMFLVARHIRRHLNNQIQLMPLLGQKRYQELREQQQQTHTRTWIHELRELEEAVTTLSYQMEAQEKTVDIRQQEVERLSLYDPVTGLANRQLFQYELKNDLKQLSSHTQDSLVAVLLLDLDNFKRINDSLGHQLGDIILEKMAKRLKGALQALGLVARLGGDEFAILLRSAKRPDQLHSLSQKILELINRPLKLDNTTLVISCSIGLSIASPEDSYEDLLKHAEIAMYKAKKSGGNAHLLFNTQMAAEAQDKLSLESELRRGFKDSEFTLYLQPKVNMNGLIKGFESLVRWDHPDRGTLPPSEFIAAMENMGFISQLDNWVLEASFRQLKVLEPHYPEMILGVNISSTHFTKKRFLTFLQECLQKYPINPSRLELEITETLLMENMNAGREVINKIKQMGFRIAIDDFGTGYSSLSYLKNLPVDSLKIDREFIKDIPNSESDMQISSAIIFLAKQMHFTVVAEGVETSEQMMFLKANQCDLAQGFFFSKPIPAHKAILMLESERLDRANNKLTDRA